MKSIYSQNKYLISDFELLSEIGRDLSMQFYNVYAPTRRMGIATQILAKLLENSFSILKLLPNTSFSKNKSDHIDFSSICSLSRNLLEASNLHWYISVEKITPDEEALRLMIYDYHDTCELLAIAKLLKFKITDVTFLENQLASLRPKLEQDFLFGTVDIQTRKKILKGQKGSLLSQIEIAQKRVKKHDKFKGMYKLLSNHTHTSPTSIKLLVASKLNEECDDLNTILTLLTIEYCNSFLADTILNTGRLWKIRFAKKESAKIVRKYSRRLFLSNGSQKY